MVAADATILIANERTPKPEMTLIVTLDGWFRDIDAHPVETDDDIASMIGFWHDNDSGRTEIIGLHLDTRLRRADDSGVRTEELARAVRRLQAAATAKDPEWAKRIVYVLDENLEP